MKTIKTSELVGTALDWVLARIEFAEEETIQLGFIDGLPCAYEDTDGKRIVIAYLTPGFLGPKGTPRAKRTHPDAWRYSPSSDWAQGGSLAQRELIGTVPPLDGLGWAAAYVRIGSFSYGATPLIAAMRCFVSNKLGDEVEVPDELFA